MFEGTGGVILLPILAAAAACSTLFCEAEQAEIEAEREFEIVLAAAQTAAELEREAYQEWASHGRQSTFTLDEVEALARSQAEWRESMEADCALFAARFRRAVTSTVPIEMEMRCRADRLRERQAFLIEQYDLSGDAPIEGQSTVTDDCSSTSSNLEYTECWQALASQTRADLDTMFASAQVAARKSDSLEGVADSQEWGLEALLEDTQTEWDQFVERQCRFSGLIARGGTGTRSLVAQCEYILNLQRIEELENAIMAIEYSGG